MNSLLVSLISYSNIIAGIICIYRFKKLQSTYYPFVTLVFLGITNEIVSSIFISQKLHTIVNNNIYVLVEASLISWFFRSMGLYKKHHAFLLIIIVLNSFWLSEIFLKGIHHQLVYFRVFYSFIVVLQSISMINLLLLTENQTSLKNPTLLICISFIAYFTLNTLVNTFWLYGLGKSEEFLLKIHIIMMYTNLFTNLMLALAVLWIPKKQPSILPF
jgi:hypothetical protein